MTDRWLAETQKQGLKLAIKYRKKIASKRSQYQLIEIFETESHGKVLLLDKKMMLTQKDEFIYHEMLCHVPLFQINKPKRVLIIGGGDGGSVRECLKHKSIEEIHLCEIDKDVIDLSKKFLKFTADSLKKKQVSIFIEDGFKFLENISGNEKYDVILVDSADPVDFGEKLFGSDFYKLAKKVLSKNGVICCQSESPFFHSEIIPKAHKRLAKIFKNVSHFTAPVTTYPSGYWSFVIASDNSIQLNNEYYESNYVRKNFLFYNKRMHWGSFCLPNFFEDLISSKMK